MKKNTKLVTVLIAALMLLTGINTSLSSYGISLKEVVMLSVSDTGTGTGTGTDDGSIENAILVSGEDCSWKVPSYDTQTGKITGYTIFTAVQSLCKSGSATCKRSNQIPCTVTSIEYKPV